MAGAGVAGRRSIEPRRVRQAREPGEGRPAKPPYGRVDQARVVAANSEPQNWFTTGRTFSEERFSPLDQINVGNVQQLGFAWQYDLQTERGLEATPVVVDGVLFASSNWSKVYALDARTGRELWAFDPKVPGEWARNACCDRRQSRRRGVAGQSLCGHARRTTDRARCQHRQGAVESGHAHRSLALLHDHRRAAYRRRQSDHRQRRRRDGRARLHHCL